MLACQLRHTDLVRSLLSSSLSHDFSERLVFDQEKSPRGSQIDSDCDGQTSLMLLMRPQGRSWHAINFESSSEASCELGLQMVERGASFVIVDHQDQSALGIALEAGRENFIVGLRGHPDFIRERIQSLRVGALDRRPSRSEGDEPASPRPDRRPSLIAKAVLDDRHLAIRALVESARLPLNELDVNGRYPIAHAQTLPTLELLLELGADPSLEDADGLNALAHAQDVADTATRDKMIARIAQHMLRARKNPSDLAAIQNANIAGLLEAAEKAPKSSMLRTISAFKFDASKVADEHGFTPLMAALRGGRLASAEHLLGLGCDLNARTDQGIPACAFLAAGFETPNGPRSLDLLKAHGAKADWSAQDHEGLTPALRGLSLSARANSYRPGALSFLAALKPHCLARGLDLSTVLVGRDGQLPVDILADVFLSDSTRLNLWNAPRQLLEAHQLWPDHPDSIDALSSAALRVAGAACSHGEAAHALRTAQEALKARSATASPPRRLALAWSQAPLDARQGFAATAPDLLAWIERHELSLSSSPAARPSAASGSRPRL